MHMRQWTPITVAIAIALTATAAARGSESPPLATLARLDPARVTVSGISSGGFFAHQFHVAFSSLVEGAGIIAGGPYACAEQIPWALGFNPLARVTIALGVCTRYARGAFDPFDLWLPDAPDAEEAIAAVRAEHAADRIDDPANLADDRVWLFLGDADGIVPLATMQALEGVYAGLGLTDPALEFERNAEANHGLPIEEFTGTTEHTKLGCGDYGPPFLIDCDFDAAERLLRHLYPAGFAEEPGTPEPDRLAAFDQSEFFDVDDPSVSLAATGFLYVPETCRDDAPPGEPCRLHVAFHGCQQYAGLIGDDFYLDGGYNRWAEANRIVVLYPQTTPWERTLDPTGLTANPKGCWDWWGYSGPDYFRREGQQMRAVHGMIERLLPQ
jgi:hypothetical protein